MKSSLSWWLTPVAWCTLKLDPCSNFQSFTKKKKITKIVSNFFLVNCHCFDPLLLVLIKVIQCNLGLSTLFLIPLWLICHLFCCFSDHRFLFHGYNFLRSHSEIPSGSPCNFVLSFHSWSFMCKEPVTYCPELANFCRIFSDWYQTVTFWIMWGFNYTSWFHFDLTLSKGFP